MPPRDRTTRCPVLGGLRCGDPRPHGRLPSGAHGRGWGPLCPPPKPGHWVPGRSGASRSPEDGTLQAPDLLLRLLREAALPGMPMHGLGSASALADRGGETEGERKTGGAGSFARRKPLLGCSEGGRRGPRCCPPPLPGCSEPGARRTRGCEALLGYRNGGVKGVNFTLSRRSQGHLDLRNLALTSGLCFWKRLGAVGGSGAHCRDGLRGDFLS